MTEEEHAQQVAITRNQERITGLQNDINKLEIHYDKQVQDQKTSFDTYTSLLKAQIYKLNQDIDEEKKQRKKISDEIEELTHIKGSISEYYKRIKELDKQIGYQNERVELLKQEYEKFSIEIEAIKNWENYLVSGNIPSFDSSFWSNLETMLKIRHGESGLILYLKPSSEAVRASMIALFKRMVKEDIANISDYKRLEIENYQSQKELAEERKKNEV